MSSYNKNEDFKKPNVDEDYLMNIISGDEPVSSTLRKSDLGDFDIGEFV